MKKFCKALGFMHKEEVAAVFERPCCGLEEVLYAALMIVAGKRRVLTDRAGGKIGGIGYAAGKAAWGEQRGDMA